MMGGMWIRGLQPGVTGMLRSRADLGAETQREWGDPFSKRTLTIEKGTVWGLDMEQKPQGAVKWSQWRRSQSRAGLWITSVKFPFQRGRRGLSQSGKLEHLTEIRKWLPTTM